MSPIKRSRDNVIYTYDEYVYWYEYVKERRTRFRFQNLKNAQRVFKSVMKDHMDLLQEEGYSEDQSPALEWYYNDYFNYNGQELCPADMVRQIDRFIEQ